MSTKIASFDQRRRDRHKHMMAVHAGQYASKRDPAMYQLDTLLMHPKPSNKVGSHSFVIKHRDRSTKTSHIIHDHEHRSDEKMADNRNYRASDDIEDSGCLGDAKTYLALRRDALIYRLMSNEVEMLSRDVRSRLPSTVKAIRVADNDKEQRVNPLEKQKHSQIRAKMTEIYHKEQNKRIRLEKHDCIDILIENEVYQEKPANNKNEVFNKKSTDRIMQAMYGDSGYNKIKERKPKIEPLLPIKRSKILTENVHKSSQIKELFHSHLIEQTKESVELLRYRRAIETIHSKKSSESSLIPQKRLSNKNKMSQNSECLNAPVKKNIKKYGSSLDIHKKSVRKYTTTEMSNLPVINPLVSIENSHSRWEYLKSLHLPKPESSVMAIEAWNCTKNDHSLLSDLE